MSALQSLLAAYSIWVHIFPLCVAAVGCPFNLAPVCGKNGKSYDNECRAKQAGTQVKHQGVCKKVSIANLGLKSTDVKLQPRIGFGWGVTAGRKVPGVVVKPEAKPSKTKFGSKKPICPCPFILLPVCGSDGKVYDNKCLAKCAGVEILPLEKCGPRDSSSGARPLRDNCDCPTIIKPVCSHGGKRFSNACQAKCAGVYFFWECHPHPIVPTNKRIKPTGNKCDCPTIIAPVCSHGGKRFSNACQAKCAGVTFFWDCQPHPPPPSPPTKKPFNPDDCECPPSRVPVCGADWKTYPSRCFAYCAGVDVLQPGKCLRPVVISESSSVEVAPLTYESPEAFQKSGGKQLGGRSFDKTSCRCSYTQMAPVCGRDGSTYTNSCFAKCARVQVARKGSCQSEKHRD